ncbi:MAG: trypsin-like peptidase domain-containing protein [Anaerolineae bacterium]|nr:trypsin-like peptidase domain-containing protein [Anaerolineae bacterium]
MNSRLRARVLRIVGLLVVFSLGCLTVPTVTREGAPRTEQLATPVPPTPVPTAAPVVVPPPGDALQDLQTQVEAVYAAAGDSVVNIAVTVMAYDFFYNAMPQEGSGSGFVYDEQGHIVTNYHVVEGAEQISVTFSDGTTLAAEVVGEDPTYDLAVVKVDPTAHTLRPVVLGDSENLTIGQFVVAIGSPFGLEQSLTFGVISSLKRVIQSPDQRFIGEAIQTDAAINPGNSGGPLLDLEGRVIGVNAQIVSTSQSNAGIGFAIPVRLVIRVVPELIATGTYKHPWMGVGPVGLTSQLVKILRDAGYDVPDEGVLVVSVEPGSAAAKAGLRGAQRRVNTRFGTVPVGGDVILSINGTLIMDGSGLVAFLETYTVPGDTVTVSISRDGELMEVPVTLGERIVD